MRTARCTVLAAGFAAGLLSTGCKAWHDDGTTADPRDLCRRSFSTCAPPARFRPDLDVTTLEVRKLVQLASRIDAGSLSASAATRLRKLAKEGDAALLVEMESAMEDAESLLGKCRCEGIVPEIEKKGIRAIVASRLPPRELRAPGTWADRVVVRLAAMRDLARRSAELAISGGTDSGAEDEAPAREEERQLCETVHAARAVLSQESFATMVETVISRRDAEAGAGSADIARRAMGEYGRSGSCEPVPE